MKVSEIPGKHGFYVLSSDFEGIIKKHAQSIYDEACKIFSRSKRLKGIYVAKQMDIVPEEFQKFINLVYNNKLLTFDDKKIDYI